MEKEWSDKRKYKKTLETLMDIHILLMKFLLETEGEDLVKKYYFMKNEMMYEKKVGKGVKIGSKVLKTLSTRKFFDIFITQLIKNVQFMIPIKCITGVDHGENVATIHINQCLSKDLFRRGIKNYKVQHQIQSDAFCKLNCIPAFQTFGRIGDIKLSAIYKENGCDIKAEIMR